MPAHEAQRRAVEMGAVQCVRCLDFAGETVAGLTYEERVWGPADAQQVSRCAKAHGSGPTGGDALRGYWDERALV